MCKISGDKSIGIPKRQNARLLTRFITVGRCVMQRAWSVSFGTGGQ
jgi:hypothetical protein